jgi:hypothetical protein
LSTLYSKTQITNPAIAPTITVKGNDRGALTFPATAPVNLGLTRCTNLDPADTASCTALTPLTCRTKGTQLAKCP